MGREALQGSLQRAAILTTDKFKGVRLQLAQNQMKISSSNAEQEEAQEEIDIDYGFEPLDVGFNVGYLQMCIRDSLDRIRRAGRGEAALPADPGTQEKPVEPDRGNEYCGPHGTPASRTACLPGG